MKMSCSLTEDERVSEDSSELRDDLDDSSNSQEDGEEDDDDDDSFEENRWFNKKIRRIRKALRIVSEDFIEYKEESSNKIEELTHEIEYIKSESILKL
jgi:hypothetical protein